MSLSARWQYWWFTPAAPQRIVIFRTGLGLITLLWFATLLPDAADFFGRASLAPQELRLTGKFTIYRWFDFDRAVHMGLWIGVLASGCLLMGKFTRVAGPVIAVLVTSTMAENPVLWNAGDGLLQTFVVLFGLYCLLTPSPNLQAGPVWFFQLVKLQMTVVYLIAFISKVPGSTWREGTAVMSVFRLDGLERLPTPDFLETNFLLGNVLTWGALLLEGALPVLLWRRSTRLFAVGSAVVFHLIIDWALAIGLFSWVMILGLLAFIESTDGDPSSSQPNQAKSLEESAL